jgi:catechol 2,3-dioxygenase-like lactoylglutathione lyase family enzyme
MKRCGDHQRLYEESRSSVAEIHNAPVQKRGRHGVRHMHRRCGRKQGGKEMIRDVPLIGIFVNDQDAALDFYTNKLGLEKVQDEAYGPQARWITVSPAGSRIRIVLKKAEKEYEKAMVGNSDGAPVLTLSTDDVHAAYEQLRERGVRFLGEPYRYPWGIGALVLDQDSSPILLQQESGER